MRIMVLFFLFLALSASKLQAQIEEDKIAHFGLGIFTGAAGAFVASEITDRNRFWTVTGSIAGSLMAGLAKEALDRRNGFAWDNADVGATVLGGVTVGITIELVAKKEGKRYRRKNRNMSSNQDNTAAAEFLLLDAENNLDRSVISLPDE